MIWVGNDDKSFPTSCSAASESYKRNASIGSALSLNLGYVPSVLGLLGRAAECSTWGSEATQIQLRLLIEASYCVLAILLQRVGLVVEEV